MRWFTILIKNIKKMIKYNFDYPLEVSKNSNKLFYYLDFTNAINNKSLFGIIGFDKNGVVVCNYNEPPNKIGKQYNPTYICLWALASLQMYVKTKNKKYYKDFFTQVEFLKRNVVYRDRNTAVWETNFDWIEKDAVLKAPFVDAMTQGLAISVLVRAYMMKKDREILKILKKSSKIYSINIKNGGIKAVVNGKTFYEEYPAYPLSFILDGFIFALIGLYDLYELTGDKNVYKMFKDGVNGLNNRLEKWDFMGLWSWYGSHGYLSSPMYNKMNSCLLQIIAEMVNSEKMKQTALSWRADNLNMIKKFIIGLKLGSHKYVK